MPILEKGTSTLPRETTPGKITPTPKIIFFLFLSKTTTTSEGSPIPPLYPFPQAPLEAYKGA